MRKFFKSLTYAISGLDFFFRNERNGRIQLFAFVVLLIFSVVFRISQIEWLVVLALSALVFCLEIVNSAIEQLSDVVSPDYNKQIKTVKDLSAAAVSVAALFSLIVAGLIFIPKILSFW
jgi:diacylglycerol kinase